MVVADDDELLKGYIESLPAEFLMAMKKLSDLSSEKLWDSFARCESDQQRIFIALALSSSFRREAIDLIRAVTGIEEPV